MSSSPLSAIVPQWPAPPSVSAICTTRTLGSSQGPYAQNNLALHVNDDPQRVQCNREALMHRYHLPSTPAWLEQTHSARCVVIEEDAQRCADAAVTRDRSVVLAIMTADCVPIILCDTTGQEIAAIHAGWRGLAEGIIENTLKKMQHRPQNVCAWIGPAICGQCYGVGESMYAVFMQKYPYVKAAFAVTESSIHADLPRISEYILRQHGVSLIAQSNQCTYENEHSLYSYRRETQTGRMATLIWFK